MPPLAQILRGHGITAPSVQQTVSFAWSERALPACAYSGGGVFRRDVARLVLFVTRMSESTLSPFQAVIAAFTAVATFALGYEYWRLSVRQDEQDARIERQREEFERSLFSMERDADEKRGAAELELQLVSLVSPHLGKLGESGREAAPSQRIVAAAADILAARGRPALSQMVEKIREQRAPSAAPASQLAAAGPASPPETWLVLLATLPGTNRKAAERVADDKFRAAKNVGLTSLVSIYKTKLKSRYVVALGKPADRSAAVVSAARARRANLAADAFAEPDGGWELMGTAPFATEIGSAFISSE